MADLGATLERNPFGMADLGTADFQCKLGDGRLPTQTWGRQTWERKALGTFGDVSWLEWYN